ncbi:MAG: carbon starvation protein A, partial [Myxococcales bacterium]|nr:carbon starvation protein A [Myxococcales bacterium]
MSAMAVALGSVVAFLLAYRFYGRFISQRVLGLRDSEPMPSHQFADGVDFVPTKRPVLFGHHFASIAGAGPIV